MDVRYPRVSTFHAPTLARCSNGTLVTSPSIRIWKKGLSIGKCTDASHGPLAQASKGIDVVIGGEDNIVQNNVVDKLDDAATDLMIARAP
eukprot:2065481-Amphidinium_carterae.1